MVYYSRQCASWQMCVWSFISLEDLRNGAKLTDLAMLTMTMTPTLKPPQESDFPAAVSALESLSLSALSDPYIAPAG